MRISDWSSDVCSSDLSSFFVSHYAWSDALFRVVFAANVGALTRVERRPQLGWAVLFAASAAATFALHPTAMMILVLAPAALLQCGRAWCRERVGSTCRYRWSTNP